MALLDVANVRRTFGGLVALNGVSFQVPAGSIKAVIGPNGAGKTTLFNVISGLLSPSAGDIRFDGHRIDGMPPHRICTLGISRTFQNLSLFGNLTVLENVMVGRHSRTQAGFLASAFRSPGQRREERRIRDEARRCLAMVGMDHKAEAPLSTLSFGQRRWVELARALATNPRLLMLDEPASGLNTREREDLIQRVCNIRDSGVTLLLVEHDMSLVMEISDEILVLHHGQPVAEGPAEAIRNHPQVIAIYLGGEGDHAAD